MSMNTFGKSEVYCDSEHTKELILKTHPTTEGLFPHEIAMLVYTAFGQYTTAERKYSGPWYYQLGVENPDALFLSLVSRGYIRKCEDNELAEKLKMQEMRRILALKNIKSGNSRQVALQRLKENFTTEEICSACPFRYYILSDKGKEAVKNQPKELDCARAWEIVIQDESKPFLQSDQIVVQLKKDYNLSIDTVSYKGKLYVDENEKPSVVPICHDFSRDTNLRVLVDSKELLRVERVRRIYLLSTLQSIVICSLSDGDIYDCVEYSLVDGSILSRELIALRELSNAESSGLKKFHEFLEQRQTNEHGNSISSQESSNLKTFHESIKQRLTSGNGSSIFSPDSSDLKGFYKSLEQKQTNEQGRSISFFFSTFDGLTDIVIREYFAKRFSLNEIPNILPEDSTKNYVITFPKDNVDDQRLFMSMYERKEIKVPCILGKPIYQIMGCLFSNNESRIISSITKDSYQRMNIANIAERIREAFNGDIQKFVDVVLSYYPNVALNSDIRYYWPIFEHKSTPLYYTYFHKKEMLEEYKKVLLELKEEGIISSKWISEFSLYMLIKAKYSNTEYQKQFGWLGRQSLDIYIPEINTAIEYQGIQHFEAVDFFGGQEAFENTQERDDRKRKLCQENGVVLKEWDHTVEITTHNVDDFLRGLKHDK